MNATARQSTLLAVALAACAPAAERRGTDSSTDTAAAAVAAEAVSAASAERTAPSAALGESAVDSVRGIVERIGSDPTTQLVVRSADGTACALQMTAPPPVEGLDVTLWGTRDRVSATMLPGVTCTFAVARYAVRAVDGVAATDGVLRAQGDAYALETADGTRWPLRDVPMPLRALAGARIYWAGPLDGAPTAYGVLVAAAR